MSENDLKNNEQTATAVATANDAVISSFDNSLSTAFAGSSAVTSDYVASQSADSVMSNVLSSAATLDSSSGQYAAINPMLQPLDPPYNYTPVSNPTIYMSSNTRTGRNFNNATVSGAANVCLVSTVDRFVGIGSSGGSLAQNSNAIFSVGGGSGLGNAIVSFTTDVGVGNGAQLNVGTSNVLLVGGSAGNLGLQYNSAGNYALTMGSGAYLSAAGYLGGIADKGAANTALGSSLENSRTAPISTADDVNIDVGGDMGLIGDSRPTRAAAVTVIGNNNTVKVGATLGVFLNASMTMGSNNSFVVGRSEASTASVTAGIFIGSGGAWFGGDNTNYHIYGGLGAGYINDPTSGTGSAARLDLGDNATVLLDDESQGIFASEAGAIVTVGSNFNLRGLEISVGRAQVASDGAAVPTNGAGVSENATMNIGDNAIISLGAAGLNNKNTAQFGEDGVIIVDAVNNGVLTIGDNLTLRANQLSIGNYSKEYVGDFGTTSINGSAYFDVGNNNSVVIGSGANLSFADGILLDGMNNNLVLNGGAGVVNQLSAGYFHADRFFKTYSKVTLGGSTYTYNNTSGANITIGDNYNVTLTSSAELGNDGNLAIKTVSGVMNVGNDFTLNANSVVIGDSLFTGRDVSGVLRTYASSTRNASMTYGTSTTLNLSGAVMLNGSNNAMNFGDYTTLNAQTISLGNGAAGSGNISNNFIVSNNANIVLQNGLTDNLRAGNFTIGNNGNLYISTGNLTLLGSGYTSNSTTTRNIFTVGDGTSITALNGDLVVGNSYQTFATGSNATLNVNNVSVNGTYNSLTFGAENAFNVGNSWFLDGGTTSTNANAINIGSGARGALGNVNVNTLSGAYNKFTVTSANGAVFNNVNLGSSATFLADGGNLNITSVNLSSGAVLSLGANTSIGLSNLVVDGTTSVVVGAGAVLNVGELTTINDTTLTTFVINGGGHLIVDNKTIEASPDLSVDFQNQQNGIYEYHGDILDAQGHLTISNFDFGGSNQLIFNLQGQYADESKLTVTVSGTGNARTLVVSFDGTPIATFKYVGGTNLLDARVIQNDVSDTGYQILITKCFLTGTSILTPNGEVTVEELKAGDEVVTLKDGQHTSKRIVWVGNMSVNVDNYKDKDALYPVRIKAHAFGLNQPCRDLLVTPEHTIYVDGGLVPARMLVNGRSIIVDTSMTNFTVYHVETEEHSILLSENLTTESYLNTDDRHMFVGDAVNLHLTFNEHAGHASWETHAAAPLMVAKDQVESIWQRLDTRATQQGYTQVAKAETTRDPSLCLITQKGEKLQPVDVKNGVYSFYIPANVRVVAMHSKAAQPAQVAGPFVDDRRMLGVSVASISVFGDQTVNVVPANMADLSGWHAVETNKTDRWTAGLATLPEEVSAISDKVKLIKIDVTDVAEYFVDDAEVIHKIA